MITSIIPFFKFELHQYSISSSCSYLDYRDMTFHICVGERFFALDRHFWIEIHFMHDLVVITTVCHYQRTNQANVKSKMSSIQSFILC